MENVDAEKSLQLCSFAESFLGRNVNCVNGGDFCCCDVLRMMGIRGAGKLLRVFCVRKYTRFFMM